jgi:hypothetical protein
MKRRSFRMEILCGKEAHVPKRVRAFWYVPIEGDYVDVDGTMCVVHEDQGKWFVTDDAFGLPWSGPEPTREAAIESAKTKMAKAEQSFGTVMSRFRTAAYLFMDYNSMLPWQVCEDYSEWRTGDVE